MDSDSDVSITGAVATDSVRRDRAQWRAVLSRVDAIARRQPPPTASSGAGDGVAVAPMNDDAELEAAFDTLETFSMRGGGVSGADIGAMLGAIGAALIEGPADGARGASAAPAAPPASASALAALLGTRGSRELLAARAAQFMIRACAAGTSTLIGGVGAIMLTSEDLDAALRLHAAFVAACAPDAASSARRGGTLGSGAFFARDATRALAQLLGIGGGGAAESVGARAARRGWARVLVPLLLSFADAAAVDSDAKVRLNLSGRLFATQ